uniref:FGENESH: predicted gene_4.24 protein n=1 Tax=Rhodotorula toruloides TaxID=5286 RepID=A0A0K3CCT6_RHOTO
MSSSAENADPPEDLRRALGMVLTHNASLAGGEQKGDQPSLHQVRTMEEYRKCRYEMDLDLDKLERLDNPPGFAYVVWRRWECSERLEGLRNGRKLDELKAEGRGLEDQLAFWKKREEVFVTDRKLEKQAFEMFTLIKHISDARWVIFQLHHAREDSTVASVLKWIQKRIAAAERDFEENYGGPRYEAEPHRSSSSSSHTGHIPIVLDHRPRLPPAPEAPSQSVFESTSEDEDPDEEDFGAPLARVSSNRPPPHSRHDRNDDEERGGRLSRPPPQSRARTSRSGSRRASTEDLPTRRPTLNREQSDVGRPRSRHGRRNEDEEHEHAERSMGRAGTYRMARRYFGREY